ncbi:hypothetical protein [Saccharopolyspora sp. SCSIO 74807]|uniref:hypothetical protein n=1 Tax=Saccharopolyspora sp. SCSIO 74807 TaxID=3118084 RepID=UPI0030D23616
MSSRSMALFLVRTLAFLAVALVVGVIFGWSWPAVLMVGLIGAAAAVQLGLVLRQRRKERAARPSGEGTSQR